MKGKKSTIILNSVLIVGVAFFIAMFITAIFEAGKEHNAFIDFLPFVQVVVGFVGLGFTLKYTKKAYQIFIELTLISWGLVVFFVVKQLTQYSMLQCWPLIGVLSGLCLFLSGLYHYRKIKFGYFVPSCLLVTLGFVFSIFSFKLFHKYIKFSFIEAVAIAGPAIFLFGAIFITCLYFAQKKNKKLILEDDGQDSFDDDVLN